MFWLDKTRPHDAEIRRRIGERLSRQDGIHILAPADATSRAFEAIHQGRNCIAVTGNVLRDYLTDLFPILEVGTSAKMLSVVGLMNGGGLFETGAGGSAPKHVEQLAAENHLRWDSLGEFCAIAEALRFEGAARGNPKALVLGQAADTAIERLLSEDKSPGRKVGETDARDSHFFFALYWAEALATQSEHAELAQEFSALATSMQSAQPSILEELHQGRGKAADLGGYFHVPSDRAAEVMRPSTVFNDLIDTGVGGFS